MFKVLLFVSALVALSNAVGFFRFANTFNDNVNITLSDGTLYQLSSYSVNSYAPTASGTVTVNSAILGSTGNNSLNSSILLSPGTQYVNYAFVATNTTPTFVFINETFTAQVATATANQAIIRVISYVEGDNFYFIRIKSSQVVVSSIVGYLAASAYAVVNASSDPVAIEVVRSPANTVIGEVSVTFANNTGYTISIFPAAVLVLSTDHTFNFTGGQVATTGTTNPVVATTGTTNPSTTGTTNPVVATTGTTNPVVATTGTTNPAVATTATTNPVAATTATTNPAAATTGTSTASASTTGRASTNVATTRSPVATTSSASSMSFIGGLLIALVALIL